MTNSFLNPFNPRSVASTEFMPKVRSREQLIRDAPWQVRSSGKCVPQLVTEHAEASGESLAIVDDTRIMTYRQMHNRACELARHLRLHGVGPDVVVGLCIERSPAMVVGALGILMAGGAYLPMDPAYPKERLTWMLEDAQPKLLVTRENHSRILPDRLCKQLHLDNRGKVEGEARNSRLAAPSTITPDQLAYVIYTSGSTGTPKGVEITHGSLLNLVQWHQKAFELKLADRATQLASPGFDAAVWEIWPYLTMGASIFLPENSLRSDPEGLRDWLLRQRINISFVPTPMAERMISLPWPARTPLRIMLTGGDKLHRYPPSTLPFILVNNYGPTEYTVVTTSGIVSPVDHPSACPAIGRPISNTQIYILNEDLHQVPIGEPGEIYIGGVGLARGYRNQSHLTDQRFVSIPLGGEQPDRVYRTGDRARWLPDGQIEYLGRVDEQIKVRGFRIEPNEITAVLDACSSLEASVVVARPSETGESILTAYVVIREDDPVTASTLRDLLLSKLPEYMVPSVFVRMQSLPVTPNGKVDRAALPEPDATNILRDAASPPPSTPVEKEVAAMVASLLEMESVARDDNFFLLGGHSLLGTQLIARIREKFSVEFNIAALFDHPTVAEIAAEIDRIDHPAVTPRGR